MTNLFCPNCMEELTADVEICPACGGDTNRKNDDHMLQAGSLLQSRNGHRFLFGSARGEGGFGITYIARDLNSGRLTAIKEYYPAFCQPAREGMSVYPLESMEENYRYGMGSFLREASLLKSIAHIDSVVHVLDHFEANNTAYMVMEYLNGITLRSLIERQGGLDPEGLLRRFLPLIKDIAEFHSSGVLHRDIAPDNIMLMPNGRLKLLDFGSARSIEDGRSMTVLVKPGFAPIEQYQTRGQDTYTDVYALCATLYYCMSGRIPPAAPERIQVIADGNIDPLLPLSQLGVRISPKLERLLAQGLAPMPKDRLQKMDALLSGLENTPEGRRIMGLDRPDDHKISDSVKWAVIGLVVLILIFLTIILH